MVKGSLLLRMCKLWESPGGLMLHQPKSGQQSLSPQSSLYMSDADRNSAKNSTANIAAAFDRM